MKITNKMRNSLHKYFRLMVKDLNEQGWGQKQIFDHILSEFEVDTTVFNLKYIFRAIGKAKYGKESTEDLTCAEMQDVYLEFDKKFAEVTGISHEWPHEDDNLLNWIENEV